MAWHVAAHASLAALSARRSLRSLRTGARLRKIHNQAKGVAAVVPQGSSSVAAADMDGLSQ
eukprot:13040211-Alexandrium_andersonii.AAC.1